MTEVVRQLQCVIALTDQSRLSPSKTPLPLSRWWSRRRLVDIVAATGVVRAGRLLQRDVVVVVAVVALVRVVRLAGILAVHRAGRVLRRGRLLLERLLRGDVVFRLLAVAEPAVAVLGLLAGGHPACPVDGLHAAAASASVAEAGPEEEHYDEEDDDDCGEHPAAPVVPVAGRAPSVVVVVARWAVVIAVYSCQCRLIVRTGRMRCGAVRCGGCVSGAVGVDYLLRSGGQRTSQQLGDDHVVLDLTARRLVPGIDRLNSNSVNNPTERCKKGEVSQGWQF